MLDLLVGLKESEAFHTERKDKMLFHVVIVCLR